MNLNKSFSNYLVTTKLPYDKILNTEITSVEEHLI